MNKLPFFWDKYSDQPKVIQDKAYKKTMRKKYFADYIKLVVTSLFILPISFLLMKFFRGKEQILNKEFIGLGVNLDKGRIQEELVAELGVKHIIIRMPLWEIEKVDEYVNFAERFINQDSEINILLNIMQDRIHIENQELLKKDIKIVFEKFAPFVQEYQVGTTINRTKWGFFSVVEFLDFYKIVQNVRDKSFENLKLIGPSVIDFEYYYTIRALFNFKDIKYDKHSSLLYVDRRGEPNNTQYAYFDTKNKIDLLYALTRMSWKTTNAIYITEVNWPLSNTAPYSPTSEKECVSNEVYTKYMKEYFQIAKNSKKIQRVYWHQLIAPGYGLVDNRDDRILKLPQFYAFKELINGK